MIIHATTIQHKIYYRLAKRGLQKKGGGDHQSILMDVSDEVLWLRPSLHVWITLVTKSLLGTSHDRKL